MVSKITVGSAGTRFEICKKCEFFQNGWCGTPVIGSDVEYNGVKYHTCGCHMETKVLFPALSCPVGKWHGVVTLDEPLKKRIRKFVSTLNPFRVTDEESTELFKLLSIVNNKHTPRTTCSGCLNNIIQDMKKLSDGLYFEVDDVAIEQAQEPIVDNLPKKKERRKRKSE